MIKFQRCELFETRKWYILIPRIWHWCFRLILEFQKTLICFKFYHFGRRSRVVFGFFVSCRPLLVQHVSFLTPSYLGKNYAHRKRMVQHVSKLHLSDWKNVNVSLTENCLRPAVNCQHSYGWKACRADRSESSLGIMQVYSAILRIDVFPRAVLCRIMENQCISSADIIIQ